MFPDSKTVADNIAPLVVGRGRQWRQDNVILLAPNNNGWTVRMTIAPDVVRFTTGLGVRINIANDDPSDPNEVELIVEVVEAILSGSVEEYFGTGDDGALVSIGHRVWSPHRERATIVTSTVTVRAPRWA